METNSVYSYPEGASIFGVLDMGGNIWEWTRSVFRSYPYVFDDGRENSESKGAQILRGGPYGLTKEFARCACRGWFDPNGNPVSRNLLACLGFRFPVS